MAQDTRKDPRAKVLTMTVRYKSATLDEFIENHSHDVSRGGMFIKTPSPFPPGTLLKFEVRISGEQRLMQGVGRVVWRRDPADAAAERPAGMGIKFIKLDDKSKQVIESLVDKRRDEDSAYELGAKSAASAPAAQPPEHKVVEEVPTQRVVLPGPPKQPPVSEDRTMVKQAAELLQEALREAGGSIDEVEETPAVQARPKPEVAAQKPEPVAPKPLVSDKPKTAMEDAPRKRTSAPARATAAEERSGGGSGRAIVVLLAIGVAVAVVYFFVQRGPAQAPAPTESAEPAAQQQLPETPRPEHAAPPEAVEPAATAPASSAVVDAAKPEAEAEAEAKPEAPPEPEKPALAKPAPVAPKAPRVAARPRPKTPAAAVSVEAGAPEVTPAAEPEPESAPVPAPEPAAQPTPKPDPEPQTKPSTPSESNPY